MRVALLGLVLVGCRALPPPPMTTLHADTSASERDAIVASIVVGVVGGGNILSSAGGIGAALRVEHQSTTRTALGLELTAGTGDDGAKRELWLVAVRGYGHFTPRSRDWVAATYSVGLSYLDVGLVALTAHGGAAISYVNDWASPLLHAGLAASLVLREGRRFGTNPTRAPCFGCSEPRTLEPPDPPLAVTSELYWFVDGGVVVPIGKTGNRLSLELSLADPLTNSDDDAGLYSLSIGDSQRFE